MLIPLYCFSNNDQNILKQSFELAKKFHEPQKRKFNGEPYINHCIRVQYLLWLNGERNTNVLCAAMMHDLLEDTTVSSDDIIRVTNEQSFHLVVELTDQYTKEKYPELLRCTRKSLELNRLAIISNDATNIKMCDIIDNLPNIFDNGHTFGDIYFQEKFKFFNNIILNDQINRNVYDILKNIIEEIKPICQKR